MQKIFIFRFPNLQNSLFLGRAILDKEKLVLDKEELVHDKGEYILSIK